MRAPRASLAAPHSGCLFARAPGVELFSWRFLSDRRDGRSIFPAARGQLFGLRYRSSAYRNTQHKQEFDEENFALAPLRCARTSGKIEPHLQGARGYRNEMHLRAS